MAQLRVLKVSSSHHCTMLTPALWSNVAPLPTQPSLCSGHRGDDTHPLSRPLLPLLWHPLHHRSQHDHGRCVRWNTSHPYRRVGSGVCPFSAIGYVSSSCILATHCMLYSILYTSHTLYVVLYTLYCHTLYVVLYTLYCHTLYVVLYTLYCRSVLAVSQ